MAVSASNLTSATGSGASLATPSVTPTANVLILVTVGNRKAATDTNTPTVSGNGLTYVQVVTGTFLEAGKLTNRCTVFRAMGSAPSAGAITADFAAQTQDQIGIVVNEYASVDTGGTNGSSAVVQSAATNNITGPAASTTLAAFASAANATFGATEAGIGGTPTITAGSGYTVTKQVDDATIVTGTEFRSDNSTTVDCTWSGSGGGSMIGIEIKAAPLVSNPPTLLFMGVG